MVVATANKTRARHFLPRAPRVAFRRSCCTHHASQEASFSSCDDCMYACCIRMLGRFLRTSAHMLSPGSEGVGSPGPAARVKPTTPSVAFLEATHCGARASRDGGSGEASTPVDSIMYKGTGAQHRESKKLRAGFLGGTAVEPYSHRLTFRYLKPRRASRDHLAIQRRGAFSVGAMMIQITMIQSSQIHSVQVFFLPHAETPHMRKKLSTPAPQFSYATRLHAVSSIDFLFW